LGSPIRVFFCLVSYICGCGVCPVLLTTRMWLIPSLVDVSSYSALLSLYEAMHCATVSFVFLPFRTPLWLVSFVFLLHMRLRCLSCMCPSQIQRHVCSGLVFFFFLLFLSCIDEAVVDACRDDVSRCFLLCFSLLYVRRPCQGQAQAGRRGTFVGSSVDSHLCHCFWSWLQPHDGWQAASSSISDHLARGDQQTHSRILAIRIRQMVGCAWTGGRVAMSSQSSQPEVSKVLSNSVNHPRRRSAISLSAQVSSIRLDGHILPLRASKVSKLPSETRLAAAVQAMTAAFHANGCTSSLE
jgi:hypothetical protein